MMQGLNIEFVNTSEAYEGTIMIGNNTMVIPFINATLMRNINLNDQNSFVDFFYVVLETILRVEVTTNNSPVNLVSNNFSCFKEQDYEYFDFRKASLKVACVRKFLIFADVFNVSKSRFIPVPTPNFPPNMEKSTVDTFFSNTVLPARIKELLGENYFNLNLG